MPAVVFCDDLLTRSPWHCHCVVPLVRFSINAKQTKQTNERTNERETSQMNSMFRTLHQRANERIPLHCTDPLACLSKCGRSCSEALGRSVNGVRSDADYGAIRSSSAPKSPPPQAPTIADIVPARPLRRHANVNVENPEVFTAACEGSRARAHPRLRWHPTPGLQWKPASLNSRHVLARSKSDLHSQRA